MKIRSRLTLQFSLLVASILILFSLTIYFLSSYYRQQEFYSRLKDRAHNTAKLLIEIEEVSSDLLKKIDKNTIALPQEKISIYNKQNEQIYSSSDDSSIIAASLLSKIRVENEVLFRDGEKEGIGFLYDEKNTGFVIVAIAFDRFGLRKLDFLKFVLTAGLIASVIIIMFAGWFYSGQALKPISKVIGQVDKISAGNLKVRVDEGNGSDEIALLAITFNKMLSRLESAFEMQRSFVSNASHELRTPLTTITGQIDVTLMKKRTNDEYEQMLYSIYEDIQQLSRLSNGLLDLAQASFDISKISFSSLRIDELLWQSRAEILKRQSGYSVKIIFENFPEDEQYLKIKGNEHLLKTAFINLMENACKFSPDKTVSVLLNISNSMAYIYFKDGGIGISPGEIEQVLEPFYRGQNARTIKGHGLGLSLTNKILQLHQGTLNISSQINHGTTVTACFGLGMKD